MEREVLTWFEENKRELPWRKSTPWGVMVSEFMLQ
jgi:A/G-specific adenine glycosylase